MLENVLSAIQIAQICIHFAQKVLSQLRRQVF